MDSLAILIPVALLLCFFVLAAFLWAVKSDQFEDLERHGQDILFDSDQEQDRRRETELREERTESDASEGATEQND